MRWRLPVPNNLADRKDFSLGALFHPRSVAVVGASKTEGKIGHSILRNIIDCGFKGPIYPVNPKETRICGLTCYPSVSAIPETPEQVVVAVPARAVLDVVRECGEKGVAALVVVTAGSGSVTIA